MYFLVHRGSQENNERVLRLMFELLIPLVHTMYTLNPKQMKYYIDMLLYNKIEVCYKWYLRPWNYDIAVNDIMNVRNKAFADSMI